MQEREGERIEQLATTAAHPAGAIAGVDKAEQGQEAMPSAVALVHRVGVQRRVFQKSGVKGAHAVALVVEGPRHRVVARGDQGAVLGIEQEHQPHQHGEQAAIHMLRLLLRQAGDLLRRRGVQAAQ